MTPNRQSPAYAPFAPSPLPCCAANSASASSSALTMEYPARRIALSLLRIKIGRQDNHRTGGWPANFERLRETKDLSALAHGNSAHPRLSSHSGELFGKDQPSSARVARRNYHAIFPRVMIHLRAHMAHNGTYFPRRREPALPAPACRGAKSNGACPERSRTGISQAANNHHPPEDTATSHGEKSYPNRDTPRG
jgi:hypothetical protein